MGRFGLVALTLLSATPAQADIVAAPEVWTVSQSFRGDKARKSLSGAACATAAYRCLAANDEKNFAQFFDIEGRQIVPAMSIGLLPETMNELDAEGVAYAPAATAGGAAHFYVIGSHGLARSGALQESRFFLLRFPVDPATGHPGFAFDGSEPAPELARTAQLRAAIGKAGKLGAHAEQKLDRNGVTIEGMAIHGEQALFGMRSPCTVAEGSPADNKVWNAYVLRVGLEALFEHDAEVEATTSELALGENTGIRDLAGVEDGVLVLSGRSDDERGDEKFTCGEVRTVPAQPWPVPKIWLWSGVDREPAKLLGELPGVLAADAAETLLVLEETEKSWRVLVLFDGVLNGKPTEFIIDKPAL